MVATWKKTTGHGAVLRGVLCLALLALAWAAQARTNISVSTDRDPVGMNESFQITFSAHGSVDGDPDFAPLSKDFQVLSTSQSSSFSIINNRIQSSKTWSVTALPRHSGKLTIPPISFGADRSPAASVEVTESAPTQGQRGVDADIYIEAQVSTTHPYVQSQVIYTLRLYRAVPTANASLDAPQMAKGDAVIERLDEDKNYETRVNGKRYSVVERKYAVYPQTSGVITISPVKFEGQVSPDTFSLLDPFGPRPKTVVRESAPVTLDVKPVPAGFTGSHWFPAKHVTLTEEWSRDPPTFKVGEPITRTLILTADGQTASQLSELPQWVPGGFRSYPDQPQLKDNKNRNGIIGSREEKTALIPNRPGDYVLPAITIPWWNVNTGKMEQATLPQRHITVAAAPGKGPAPVTPAPLGKLAAPAPAPQGQGSRAVPPPVAAAGKESNSWPLLTLVLAAVWLLTLVAWWLSGRRRHGAIAAEAGEDSLRQVRRELRAACLSHSPARVRELLLKWGRLTWPDDPPANLGEIGIRSHPALAEEIHRLNHALYSQRPGDWRGEAFWQAFEHAHKRHQRAGKAEQGRLEPLHRL
jgi:hypothetical protein